MVDESVTTGESMLSPDERRAAFRASWDVRLFPVLSNEWRSADALAEAIGEPKATVLARLKDMSTRNLAERRIVKFTVKKARKSVKRPRVHTARFEAQFRRVAEYPPHTVTS
jgi:hypothetical protein